MRAAEKEKTELKPQAFLLVLTLSYVAFLLYATLYPFYPWRWTPGSELFWLTPFSQLSKFDVITNFLGYVPLGLITTLVLSNHFSTTITIVLTTTTAVFLSGALEYAQFFLPSRVSSLTDVFVDSFGAFVGAIAATRFLSTQQSTHPFIGIAGDTLERRRLAHIGVLVLCAWALTQLIPLALSFQPASLRFGVQPLWYTLNHLSELHELTLLIDRLNLIALGLLCISLLKSQRRAIFYFALFATVVLLLKIPVTGRSLSLETIVGLAIALIALPIMTPFVKLHAIIGIPVLAIAFLITSLAAGSASTNSLFTPFNWVPFRGQLNNVLGIIDILAAIWPFTAMAVYILRTRPRNPYFVAATGGAMVLISTAWLEWHQQTLPGRYPDVTDILLALAGWVIPFAVLFVEDNLRPSGSGTTQ